MKDKVIECVLTVKTRIIRGMFHKLPVCSGRTFIVWNVSKAVLLWASPISTGKGVQNVSQAALSGISVGTTPLRSSQMHLFPIVMLVTHSQTMLCLWSLSRLQWLSQLLLWRCIKYPAFVEVIFEGLSRQSICFRCSLRQVVGFGSFYSLKAACGRNGVAMTIFILSLLAS